MSTNPFNDEITPQMGNYPILLMGSYDDGCIDRLYLLREKLRNSGYKNTVLVRDLEDNEDLEKISFDNPEIYDYSKSVYGIEWSSIILFVFFKDCSYDSMLTEMHESINTFNKENCVEFLIEAGADVRKVNLGYMVTKKLTKKWFIDESDLYQTAKSKCWNHIFNGDC